MDICSDTFYNFSYEDLSFCSFSVISWVLSLKLIATAKHKSLLTLWILCCVWLCVGVTMGGGDSGETGEVEEDLGKEEEAERERQLEAELMVSRLDHLVKVKWVLQKFAEWNQPTFEIQWPTYFLGICYTLPSTYLSLLLFLFPLFLSPSLSPSQESTTTGPIGDIDVPLDEFTFEPHVGVSEGGDDETEI